MTTHPVTTHPVTTHPGTTHPGTTHPVTDPLEIYLDYDRRQAADRGPAAPTSAATPTDNGDGVSHFRGADVRVHQRIAERVEALRPILRQLAETLHANPETAFEEFATVDSIAALLEGEGAAVQRETFGLPTSFTAQAGATPAPGVPHFAIVAEYDALPGIGHACGHNIIAGIAVGAFLAVREVIGDLDGRVSIIGTPAEESGGGKELIIRAGGFDDVDAAAMVHPSSGDEVSPIYGPGTSGVRRIAVTYHGRAAHAALGPYLGLNALDAVVTAYQSVAQLRQHILPIDRIHGVITDGGAAANIVPERASAVFLVRSSDIDTLNVLTDRVHDILQAAALSTGTRAEIDLDFEPAYLPLVNNVELLKRWAGHLGSRGRTVPLRPAVLRQGGPSTDMGNVSQYLPAIHPALGIGSAPDVLPHNAEFAAATVAPKATDALIDGAVAVAGLAADYLADADLRAGVSAEFEARGGRRRWEP